MWHRNTYAYAPRYLSRRTGSACYSEHVFAIRRVFLQGRGPLSCTRARDALSFLMKKTKTKNTYRLDTLRRRAFDTRCSGAWPVIVYREENGENVVLSVSLCFVWTLIVTLRRISIFSRKSDACSKLSASRRSYACDDGQRVFPTRGVRCHESFPRRIRSDDFFFFFESRISIFESTGVYSVHHVYFQFHSRPSDGRRFKKKKKNPSRIFTAALMFDKKEKTSSTPYLTYCKM